MTKQILPTILPRSFYLDSPEIVARNLLGKLITHHVGGVRLSGRITEGRHTLASPIRRLTLRLARHHEMLCFLARLGSRMSISSMGCTTA